MKILLKLIFSVVILLKCFETNAQFKFSQYPRLADPLTDSCLFLISHDTASMGDTAKYITRSLYWNDLKSYFSKIDTSKIIYVDRNRPNIDTTGSFDKPFHSIQSAINSISSTSFDNQYTISVATGSYNENITIDKNYVNIIGYNIISGYNTTINGKININANTIGFSNICVLNNSDTCISIFNSSAILFNNIRLTQTTSDPCIYAKNTSVIFLYNSYVQATSNYSIVLDTSVIEMRNTRLYFPLYSSYSSEVRVQGSYIPATSVFNGTLDLLDDSKYSFYDSTIANKISANNVQDAIDATINYIDNKNVRDTFYVYYCNGCTGVEGIKHSGDTIFIDTLVLATPNYIDSIAKYDTSHVVYVDRYRLNTDTTGSFDRPFHSIQAAIDAAYNFTDKKTIYIATGTYYEDLTLRHNVNLTGISTGNVNITGKIKADGFCSSNLSNLILQNTLDTVISIYAADITVNNCIISGTGTHNPAPTVYVNAGSIKLTDCYLVNSTTYTLYTENTGVVILYNTYCEKEIYIEASAYLTNLNSNYPITSTIDGTCELWSLADYIKYDSTKTNYLPAHNVQAALDSLPVYISRVSRDSIYSINCCGCLNTNGYKKIGDTIYHDTCFVASETDPDSWHLTGNTLAGFTKNIGSINTANWNIIVNNIPLINMRYTDTMPILKRALLSEKFYIGGSVVGAGLKNDYFLLDTNYFRLDNTTIPLWWDYSLNGHIKLNYADTGAQGSHIDSFSTLVDIDSNKVEINKTTKLDSTYVRKTEIETDTTANKLAVINPDGKIGKANWNLVSSSISGINFDDIIINYIKIDSAYIGGYKFPDYNTEVPANHSYLRVNTEAKEIYFGEGEAVVDDSAITKSSYTSAPIRFQVPINITFQNYTDSSTSVQDVDTLYEDWCVLLLPPTYTKNGTATKLVMLAHGAGGYCNGSGSEIESLALVDTLLANGYAVYDCNGGDNSVSLGNNQAVQSYTKAYDYIINNYNINPNLYVCGYSMGGLSALNTVDNSRIPIKCVALLSPVTALKEQAWDDPWTAVTVKLNMMDDYNFADTLTYDSTKTVGFDPYYRYVSCDALYKCSFPASIKIWHGNADPSVNILYSRYFITSIRNSGKEAYLRIVNGGTHASIFDAPYIDKEIVLFLNRN